MNFVCLSKKVPKEKTPRPKTLQFCFRTPRRLRVGARANHTSCHAKFCVRAGRGLPTHTLSESFNFFQYLLERNFIYQLRTTHYLLHSLIKSTNSGWGRSTLLRYSGWNCTPTNHLLVGISTISTSLPSGLIPVAIIPAFS